MKFNIVYFCLCRILIVQLKRYEYKPEQCESIKMSSRVHINRWITLDPYLTGDVEGPSPWSPNSVRYNFCILVHFFSYITLDY